jgi:hypothetical protein
MPMLYWLQYRDLDSGKLTIFRFETFKEWAGELMKAFKAVRTMTFSSSEPDLDENGHLIGVYWTGSESGIRRHLSWGGPIEDFSLARLHSEDS